MRTQLKAQHETIAGFKRNLDAILGAVKNAPKPQARIHGFEDQIRSGPKSFEKTINKRLTTTGAGKIRVGGMYGNGKVGGGEKRREKVTRLASIFAE